MPSKTHGFWLTHLTRNCVPISTAPMSGIPASVMEQSQFLTHLVFLARFNRKTIVTQQGKRPDHIGSSSGPVVLQSTGHELGSCLISRELRHVGLAHVAAFSQN